MISRLNSIFIQIISMSMLQIGQLAANPHQQCPFMEATTRSSSLWSSFLQHAVFLPQEEGEAVQTLLVQASELSEIFNHFKEQYVFNVFHDSDFASYSQRYAHMSFPWMIPPKMKRLIGHPRHAWNALTTNARLAEKGVLVSAYNLFQRVAIGLELVLRDLETSTEAYATKKGNFWKLSFEAANRVVEALFLVLKSRGHEAETLAVLKRDIVLARTACPTSEAERDLRDWVILSNSIQIVHLYQQLFGMYARTRH